MTRDRDGKAVFIPGWTLCTAAGRQVHHAPVIGKLRKVPDGFDPAQIPDLMKPDPAPAPVPGPLTAIPTPAWAGIVLGVLALLLGRKTP
jgi:hypothetical protein